MYIKVNNGVPENYTIGQLRKDNSNVSFPRKISNEILAEYFVYPVAVSDAPSIDSRTQKIIQNTTPTYINGEWVYEWTVTDKTQEEIAKQDSEAADAVRIKRDEKLSACDWVTVKAVDQNAQDSLGIQVPTIWLDYRQALRDITSHANFPYLQDTDWPVAP